MAVATTLHARAGQRPDAQAPEQVRLGGWFYFLLGVICLMPVVVPSGPGQVAIVDVLNIIGLGAFAAWAGLKGKALALPFAFPMFLILIGSLVAMANAESVAQSMLTLGQDLYLYLMLILMVNVMGGGEQFRRLRVAWLWTAVVISIVGVGMLAAQDPSALGKMVGLKGARAAGTFYNPNMFADYLVTSLFVIWSLGGQVSRRLLWAASAVLLFALITTKSNGGLAALVGGVAAWRVARAAMNRGSWVRVGGVLSVLIALALCGWWMTAGWGIGRGSLNALGENSFLGRVTKSSDSRMQIWGELAKRYARYPLGIGAGNSRNQRLSIATRERPESLMSKEAHNDYVGYLIERGPLALLGLLLLMGLAFLRVARALKARVVEGWGTSHDPVIAAALIGGLAATSIHSLMIEKLHFRHFWVFLALVCAFGIHVSAPSRSRGAGEAV